MKPAQAGIPGEIQERAEKVAKALDADIIIFSGPIDAPHDDSVVNGCCTRVRRKNVLLIISTFGGDPDAAYRIARALQGMYENFWVLVAGYCKSAGTLIILGANELILLEHAELGPLDIQMRKADEIVERDSGLTPNQAFRSLDSQVWEAFEKIVMKLKLGMFLTTRTAAEIASNIVTGLYSPIYAQIDPMRLGEMQRALMITLQYGERLQRKGNNVHANTLATLVTSYPDHNFVIDRAEAKTLFKRVREPSDLEAELAHCIRQILRHPNSDTLVLFLNGEPHDTGDEPQDPGAPAAGGTAQGSGAATLPASTANHSATGADGEGSGDVSGPSGSGDTSGSSKSSAADADASRGGSEPLTPN